MPAILESGLIKAQNRNEEGKELGALARSIARKNHWQESDFILRMICHFLKLGASPVWDLRIRNHAKRRQTNKMKRQQNYGEVISGWVEHCLTIKAKCDELRKLAGSLKFVPDLTLIELVMDVSQKNKK